MIEVEGLSLTLGDRQVLSNVDLKLAQGDFQLIIGPNGAGKTSLLKCLLGLHTHYQGRILLNGCLNTQLTGRERARLVAWTPQLLELQFNLTVQSFMALSRFAHNDTAAGRNAIVESSLERTGVAHMKEAFLDELSGGERQRVMIAAALAQQPKLLILDEPNQALDPSHRVELVKLLKQLYEEKGLTVVVVTHDWNAFTSLNPAVLALKQGAVSFSCRAEFLPQNLESLFGCAFNHFQAGGSLVSVPSYSTD